MENKINLLELKYTQLKKLITVDFKQPAFRADQLWQWIWQKLAKNFEDMTNLSRDFRKLLGEKAIIPWPEIVKSQKSLDGTIKFLIKLYDGKTVETVLIPSENKAGNIRWAQCISTQAGCAMGCTFCATGKIGFSRNLSMGEILSQILVGKEYLNDKKQDNPILRNIVFMGMGEPLLNLNALIPALETLANDKGMNFSPRRLTVSTCGIPEGLKILGESGLAYLAISLHAPTQKIREKIMPVAAKWPLEEMMKALKSYPIKTRERITLEYLLLDGVNDSLEDAKKLTNLASQIKAKINLINYNEVAGLPYKAASQNNVQIFQDYLVRHNITAILRKSKGADISAACGQLKAAYSEK